MAVPALYLTFTTCNSPRSLSGPTLRRREPTWPGSVEPRRRHGSERLRIGRRSTHGNQAQELLTVAAGGGASLLLPANLGVGSCRFGAAGTEAELPGGTLDPTAPEDAYACASRRRCRRSPACSNRAIDSVRDRGPPVQPADPAARPAEHHRLRLRLGRPTARRSTTRRSRSRRRPTGPCGSTGSTSSSTATGRFLPHLLPVDPTLHWANPPGGTAGRDSRPTFTSTPGPYRGPVPIVTHLHGAHISRGERRLPRGVVPARRANIPAGYATVGLLLRPVQGRGRDSRSGSAWAPGTAMFQYPNDQRATTLWFHSHELGMTRRQRLRRPGRLLPAARRRVRPAAPASCPARPPRRRPAGHPLLRDPAGHPGPVVQRRRLAVLPDQPRLLRRRPAGGPYIPTTDVPPIWNPEFFGNTMVVNGRTWPSSRSSRGATGSACSTRCNTRVVMLKIASRPAGAAAGRRGAADLGRSAPTAASCPRRCGSTTCRWRSAERADVIVDFTGLPSGPSCTSSTRARTSRSAAASRGPTSTPADPATTGQVMKFVVVAAQRRRTDRAPPASSRCPAFTPLGPAAKTRRLSLNEMASAVLPDVAVDGHARHAQRRRHTRPAAAGTTRSPRTPRQRHRDLGAAQLHRGRAPDPPAPGAVPGGQPAGRSAQPRTAAASRWETGFKDTVVALPGEITRLKATFDLPAASSGTATSSTTRTTR